MKPFNGKYALQARGAAALTAVAGFIFIGTSVYHSLEDWTWIQSFYFTVVTLTTVGYGDLTPSNDSTRLFTAWFILIGVTVVVSSIGYIGNGYINRRADKKTDRKNRGQKN